MVEQTASETWTPRPTENTEQAEPAVRAVPDRDTREYGSLHSLVGTLIVLGWLVLCLVLRNAF